MEMMRSINPATEDVIAEYPEHSSAQIEQKLQIAEKAFRHWRGVSVSDRAIAMKRVAGILRKKRDELAKLMTAEVGKTIVASEGEIEKCAGACEYFADNAAEFLADRKVVSDASNSYVTFDPLGPVLAIMPWNFPFWQVIRFAAPALMAGNVGVLKHAPNVPGCALALENIFAEAGFPPGVFSSLLILDNGAAERLVDHPMIRAVTLTGSERAGSAVAAAAGRALKKTVMELGGSDPFIVLGDADVEAVAAKAAEARCVNNGQSCIAAKRFIVEQKIANRFTDAMIGAMEGMKLGDPMDRATKIGPLARGDLLESLHGQVVRSTERGAKLRCGGRRRSGKGFFYEPTVLTEVRPGMAAFDEETFGPVAAIIRAADAKEAITLANQSRYGLGASIWTKDIELAQSLAREIESGSVFINEIVKSDARLPFGGIKRSGWGRELSAFGIQEFVNIRTIWIK
jgi:succinate-semialdehyde dehydrogenase/glutarate-semialdehyde dehydrogenase